MKIHYSPFDYEYFDDYLLSCSKVFGIVV